MIPVQKLDISFLADKGPKIIGRLNEVGRAYEFKTDLPWYDDVPEDLTYTASLTVVKPDNTFVITNAFAYLIPRDIEDENSPKDLYVMIKLTEQIVAVKGLGHYIIEVKNNYDPQDCIYTQQGDIYIDDNLLTDELIESVAEVNGYKFPDDFAMIDDDSTELTSTWSSEKIAEEIASATPDIIDDEQTLSDKTWSSEKIADELSQISPLHVYSTEEQAVGTWIDGKTVYEKTYYLSSVPTTSTSSFNLDIPNLSRIILLDGIIIGPYNAYPVNCWQNYTYSNTYAYVNMSSKAVVFYCGNMNGGTGHFILRYTKNE